MAALRLARTAARPVRRALLLGLVGVVAGAYLARTLGARLVHWDALQYHLGLPIWYLRLGGFEHFPSHVMSGISLGVDVLYGTVLTPDQPLRTIPAKLLGLRRDRHRRRIPDRAAPDAPLRERPCPAQRHVFITTAWTPKAWPGSFAP